MIYLVSAWISNDVYNGALLYMRYNYVAGRKKKLHLLGICPHQRLLETLRPCNFNTIYLSPYREDIYLLRWGLWYWFWWSRFSDTIDFNPENKSSLIVDPTFRFESNTLGRADQGHSERIRSMKVHRFI